MQIVDKFFNLFITFYPPPWIIARIYELYSSVFANEVKQSRQRLHCEYEHGGQSSYSVFARVTPKQSSLK